MKVDPCFNAASVKQHLLTLSFLLLLSATVVAQDRTSFKVCADPNSLPSSNKNQEGYENKIAKLFADDLGLPLEYEWFPQRIGFIRNTLKNNSTADGRFKCDIVMGVVENFELAATTKPYFRSAWAMAYIKGRGLDQIATQTDLINLPESTKKSLKIGVFDKSPAVSWLLDRGLIDYMVPYQMLNADAAKYPGKIIEDDLAKGKINLTFIWGPIAGYFAKQAEKNNSAMAIIPLTSEPGIKFDYKIAMAVRYGENEWKEQINNLIDKHQTKIDTILTEYGVPLLPIK